MRRSHQKRIVIAAGLAALATVIVAASLSKEAVIERVCLARLAGLGEDDRAEREVLEYLLIRVRSVHAAPFALPWIERAGDEEIPRYWEEVGAGAVPFLLDFWKGSRHLEDRGAVLRAFEWMGPRGATSIPFFLDVLSRGEPPDRADSAWALASLDPDPARAAAALAAEARDADPRIRSAAVRGLGKVGTRSPGTAGAVIPAILESTKDPEAGVRGASLHALAALIRNGITVEIPERLLEDLGRENAPRLLLRLWLRALDDPSGDVRARALRAIGLLGAEAEPAAGRLAAILLRDPSPGARIDAARALGEIGRRAAEAAPALEAASRSGDRILREAAEEALGRIRDR